MKRRATIFALVLAVLLLYAIRFSTHPVAWIIGLIAALPIGAAILAGTAKTP
jgi:hypothetical protein